MDEKYPVLLYDGVCAVCNRTVQFILKHDLRGAMRFAPLQAAYAQTILAEQPSLKSIDSVILVEGPGRIYVRSTAALRMASYLGGAWRLLLCAYGLPRPIRDFFYDLFAKYRYRIFGKYEECMRPLPEMRSRFIES